MRLCKAKGCRATLPKGSAPWVRWCSAECGTKLALILLEKKKAADQKAWQKRAAMESKRNKEDRRKLRLEDRRHQLKLTQDVCNRLVLLLDKGQDCISCGRPDNPVKRRNASHLKSVGSNSFLRYDLRNIHAACINCNLYNSGAIEGYKRGIQDRYGQAMLDYLESAPRSKDWSIEQLETMRREFAEECRRIERGEGPSKNWREI